MALLPSICKRYSPAFSSAFPTWAFCEMLMVLLKGLANTGTVRASAPSNAKLRSKELVFMRVITFRFGSDFARVSYGDTVDTRSPCEYAPAQDTPFFLD